MTFCINALLPLKKMVYKSTLLIFFAGLLWFPAIICLDISPDEREQFSTVIIAEAYEPCKHLISEENYEILADGSEIDNEETRDYAACMFASRKWIINKKLNIDLMISDMAKIRGKPFSPPEVVGAKVVLNVCKKEGESHDEELMIVDAFGKCIRTRCLTDL